MYFTTTFDRLVALYNEERRLLDKACEEDDWLTPTDQQRLSEIRASLARLWPQERKARVLATQGPPRQIGGAQSGPERARDIAYGIAPLAGGD